MKIEIGKKYRTTEGYEVKLYEEVNIRGNKSSFFGSVTSNDGHKRLTSWDSNGHILNAHEHLGNLQLGNLVEVKEDWEILIEHFKNDGGAILVWVEGLLLLIHNVKLQDYQDYFSVFYGDGLHINTWKGGVEIATLGDCKQHILNLNKGE